MNKTRTIEVVNRMKKLVAEICEVKEELTLLQSECEHTFGDSTVLVSFPSRMCTICEYIEIL